MGSILYVIIITKLDVAFIVSRLSRYYYNPSLEYQRAANKVLYYFFITIDLALFFKKEDTLRIILNSSFINNSLNRKSFQGFTIKFFSGIIYQGATKQIIIATSTIEAELLTLTNVIKESLFVIKFIKGLTVYLINSIPTLNYNN